MRTVSLTNRRKAMLPPIILPELGLVEHIIGTNERDKKTGAIGRKKVVQKLPRTITLCAKGTPGSRVDGLPEPVATSPDVVAAKKRGDIDVTFAEATQLAATPAPASAAPTVGE